MLEATTVSIVHEDARKAGRQVAAELIDQMGGPPELIILFAALRYAPQELLDGLYSRLPADTAVVGCSSFGEINSEEALSDSVTAMGLRLRGLSFRTFKIDHVGPDGFAAGAELAAEVAAFAPTLLFVFPDGLKANGTQFLLGLQSILGQRFPIIGGMAAGDVSFTRTHQFHHREVLGGGAVAVALKGPIEIVTHARSGWIPIGATRTCTKVEQGNLLVELDGQPALDLYESYLGDRVKEMPSVSPEFPIGLVGGVPSTQKMPGEQILLLRGIKSVDYARRAILLGGDIPQGGEVRMTRATKEDVIDGATYATQAVCKAMPDPNLAFFFDCAARKMALGRRYKQELQTTIARLGKGVPKIGFYTYGELSPVQGVTMHHEVTFTIALLKA